MNSVIVRFKNIQMKQSITYSLSVMEVAKILFREDKSLFRETRVVSFELKEGGGGREGIIHI